MTENIRGSSKSNVQMDNLQGATALAQSRLEQVSEAQDDETIFSEHSDERYMACALLAWQQLGHSDARSLCRFVENKRLEERTKNEETASKRRPKEVLGKYKPIPPPEPSKLSRKTVPLNTEERPRFNDFQFTKTVSFSSNNSYSMRPGPVVKLPVATKTVMRMENATVRIPVKKSPQKNISSKIDRACCYETACAERLAAMDAMTEELRSRAGLLAHREAERVELLERAEAAWKDLERGYERRLKLALEKEEDVTRLIAKAIKERNDHKKACTDLAVKLNEKSDVIAVDRARYGEVDKDVYSRACQRLKLSQESAKLDALVADQACRAAQLDRDLQLKEEQARRKRSSMESEVESVRALTIETERAMRAELSALRDQIGDVSKQLLDEDAQITDVKVEMEELRKEKTELIEVLQGCKFQCENFMSSKNDELMQKKDKLAQLKDQVMECRCKMPVHVALEAKRTPSLVGLCKCAPEDKILEACSCTSLRSKLLSNLLSDLFSGLQSEMGTCVIDMPCQLLKCLEDKHNWERTSVVKTNLKSYFSRLLVGELDIAIATSIENYSAKWVGVSCADMIQMTPDPGENMSMGWQERAIERRAQKLATKLAQQLFQDKADELTMEAKRTLESGPPPCDCRPERKGSGTQTAAFPCLVTRRSAASSPPPAPPLYWQPAVQDVTQLCLQIEDLKKDSLKKEDLKTMEDKITKIITNAPPQRLKTSSPERCMEVERRVAKRAGSKIPTPGGEGKNNATTNQTSIYTCLVKNTPADNSQESTTPSSWQQAIGDVTKLRGDIENIKKDSLKKEDLKQMEQKLAKIVQRAGIISTRMDELPRNVTNETIKKEQKNYKAINITGPMPKINNLSFRKKGYSSTNSQSKKDKISNTLLKNKPDKPCKPFKRREQQYSINVCLCSSKPQKVTNAKNKTEEDGWKEKVSKDSVSLLSSTVRQTKPINASYNSEDTKFRLFSNDSEEQSCLSNCVCFHKVPSTTSIDKLLETLAKWKSDLDKSISKKSPVKSCHELNKPSATYTVSTKQCLKKKNVIVDQNQPNHSKAIVIPKEKDCLSFQDTKGWIGLDDTNSKNSKNSARLSTDFAETIKTIDSEYMGAVNLDKSNDIICCKCVNNAHKKNTKLIKCIKSARCGCNKILETQKQETERKINVKLASVLTMQEQGIINEPVLDNISLNHAENKSKPLERNINNKLNDASTFTHVIESSGSDYKITFLGVTLADIHPYTNQLSNDNNNKEYNNKNMVIKNITTSREHDQPVKRKPSKKDIFVPYQIKNDSFNNTKASGTEFKSFANTAEGGSININVDNDGQKHNSNEENKTSLTEIRKKGKHTIYNKNEDYNNEEHLNSHKLSLPNYVNESSTNVVQNVDRHDNKKFKLIKSPSDQKMSNKRKRATNFNTNEKYLKNEITASNSIDPLRSTITKVFDDSKKSLEYKTKKMLSCECTAKYDELKKNRVNFAKLLNYGNKELDVQSLKDLIDKDYSCVCCNELNKDESKDLEENTFHLLEEYLRKKLEDFKRSSCSFSCISPKEEEEIFTVILQKVKRIILDSTNEMKCKCSAIEEKSQGSWNRAYGLLQEYLKVKIKKVQCACALVEDNKDSVLPDVLEKICKLIEYDFQRLKDVCRSQNNLSNSKEMADIHLKQVNFDVEVPVKDVNIGPTSSMLIPQTVDDQIRSSTIEHQIVHIKQNISSQVPLNLGMEIKSCGSLEVNNKDVDIQATGNLYGKNVSCDCNQKFEKNAQLFDTKCNFLGTDKNREKNEYISFHKKNVIKKEMNSTVENQHKQVEDKKYHKVNSLEDQHCSQIPASFCISSTKEFPDEDWTKLSVCDGSNVKPKLDLRHEFMIKSFDNEHLLPNISTIVNSTPTVDNKQEHENKIEENESANMNAGEHCICVQKYIQQQSKSPDEYSEGPYIGSTVSCTCDTSLGPCVCSKSISKSITEMISNIWKKSLPKESNIKNKTYIMPSQSAENINLQSIPKKNVIEENLFHDCETAIGSGVRDEQFILKSSTENVDKSHVTTNTFDDIPSIDTDYSTNEDTLDWCECCSNNNPNKHNTDFERLKSSIYFPSPITDFNEQLKENLLTDENDMNLKHTPKHICDCEKVPICHVKMLVENIEIRLANTQCTCDSMISKVCPVHSSKC